MEKSDKILNLSKALLQFHKEIGKIAKTSTNPFFKSKYADLPSILSAINEPLQNSGLVLTSIPDADGLTTILIHAESGEYISANAIMKPIKNDPQSIGSAITYQRRYSIGSILNLNIDEDDDGNKATQPNNKKQEYAYANVLPVLTPKLMEKLKERIKNGEAGVIEMAKQTMQISEHQINELNSILRGII